MSLDSKPPIQRQHAARRVMRACDRAALATLMRGDAHPYASLVAVATDFDGSPILLISQLAEHCRNLAVDSRASLLFDGTGDHANAVEGARVSAMGRIVPSPEPRLRARFLSRHPAAALYAGFGDFAIFRMEIERLHWVGGFGDIAWLGPDALAPMAAAVEFAARSRGVIADIGARTPDLGPRIARTLGRRGRNWRIAGIDPDGGEVAFGRIVARFMFDPPLESPTEAESGLHALVST